MTKLSKKLANASVEDAPKLITELAMAVWGRVDDDNFARWGTFNALLSISPEGWLSAVIMLVPEGWTVEMFIAPLLYSRTYLSRYSNGSLHPKRTRSDADPALALASAIAQTMEDDDE